MQKKPSHPVKPTIETTRTSADRSPRETTLHRLIIQPITTHCSLRELLAAGPLAQLAPPWCVTTRKAPLVRARACTTPAPPAPPDFCCPHKCGAHVAPCGTSSLRAACSSRALPGLIIGARASKRVCSNLIRVISCRHAGCCRVPGILLIFSYSIGEELPWCLGIVWRNSSPA